MGIAGRAYKEMVAPHRADPGDPEGWSIHREILLEPFEHLDPDSDGVLDPPYDPKRGLRELAQRVDVDALMGVAGVSLAAPTKLKLLEEVVLALGKAAETLQRYGSGDYSPDRTVHTYPTWMPAVDVRASQKRTGGFDALLAGWAKEKAPRQSTVDLWTTYVSDFVAFMGHPDPSQL